MLEPAGHELIDRLLELGPRLLAIASRMCAAPERERDMAADHLALVLRTQLAELLGRELR